MDHAPLRHLIDSAGDFQLPPEIEHAVTGTTLSAAALRVLGALVAQRRPRQIIEFGSGLSTRFLAGAIADLPGTALLSVENLQQFLAQTRSDLPRGARVELFHCPIRRYFFRGRAFAAYDPVFTASLSPNDRLDLVLIDGPYGGIFGREAALFQVAPYLHPGTIILLDDFGRPREQLAIAAWKKVWDDLTLIDLSAETGLAVVQIPQPTHQRRCPFRLWEMGRSLYQTERELLRWRRYRRATGL